MKLLNVKIIEETSVAIYAEVEYKLFWTGKIKKDIVFLKKTEILNKITIDVRFVHKKNSPDLFGFETLFLFCVADSIDEITAYEIVRIYEKQKYITQ